MAKFYIGLAGHNFAIVELAATNEMDALDELAATSRSGWARFRFADSDDRGIMRMDAIVIVKRYSGRFTHRRQSNDRPGPDD